MAHVIDRALADAQALIEGGLDALLVENFGDVPFAPGRAEAATVAALSVAASAIRAAWPATPLGINVLRNDARSALGRGLRHRCGLRPRQRPRGRRGRRPGSPAERRLRHPP